MPKSSDLAIFVLTIDDSGESSDKVLSWRAAIKRVTWQLSSKFLCLLSVRVTRQSSNAIATWPCRDL